MAVTSTTFLARFPEFANLESAVAANARVSDNCAVDSRVFKSLAVFEPRFFALRDLAKSLI